MTKTYIKPETKTYKIETQQIMAGTTQDVSDETPNEWGARGFNFFEEEDVEEEY